MSKCKIFNIGLSVLITATFILLGIFIFNLSYFRTIESFGDLWQSVRYYFCEIFRIEHNIMPTVDGYSDIMQWQVLPPNFIAFSEQTTKYFSLLFRGCNANEKFVLRSFVYVNFLGYYYFIAKIRDFVILKSINGRYGVFFW